jgi:aryl-alcohol dehydrogenase-like predicted oxidoreductase
MLDKPNRPVRKCRDIRKGAMMEYRTLGRTGLKVSEIGFGAWGIGGVQWLDGSDDESRRALNEAIDLGVNFIDTALAYGEGHSEELVGEVVRSRSERIFVATKVPPKNQVWPAEKGPLHEVFTADYIIRCTEKSLRNLGLETIDVQQFHVWHDDWANDPEWLEALERLRDQGKVRFFGISINDYEPANALRVLRAGHIDTVQVIYNIFEQAPENELFPVCQAMNIGVIARVPFDEGGLTGAIRPDTVFPDGDFRSWFFRGDRKQKVFNRVDRLKLLLGAEAESLPELALRFTLSHPAVSTVIPGMRTTKHVYNNVAVSDGRPLTGGMLERLRQFAWDRTVEW